MKFRQFSIKIDWNVVSRIVAMLVGAIDVVSGDLHTYFLTREMDKYTHHIINFEVSPESSLIKKYVYRSSDSTSMASTSTTTMSDITLQLTWIENGQTIVFKVSKLLYFEVTDNMKNKTVIFLPISSEKVSKLFTVHTWLSFLFLFCAWDNHAKNNYRTQKLWWTRTLNRRGKECSL